MEWGTFLTVIITLYLAYYGIVFLLDLVAKGKTPKVAGGGIEYNLNSLLEEEEVSQVLDVKAFVEPPVKTHNTPAPAPPAPPAPPVAEPTPAATPPVAEEANDDAWDEPKQPADKEPEVKQESVKMAVMGEPMPPNNYLKMVREQAMKKALSASKAIEWDSAKMN